MFLAAAASDRQDLARMLAVAGARMPPPDATFTSEDGFFVAWTWRTRTSCGSIDPSVPCAGIWTERPSFVATDARGDLEYAAAAWDGPAERLVAVRDPLGLTPLFYTVRRSGIAVSDSTECLVDHERINEEFVAQFIATSGAPQPRTVWESIHPVPPGGFLSWRGGQVSITTRWRPPSRIEPIHPEEAQRTLRTLLASAVDRLCCTSHGVWAHLSGGLDSSSVVAVAVRAAAKRPGISGTVTFVDSLGNGDETAFSRLVARRCGVGNVEIHDDWPWRSDGEAPPRWDQPARDVAMYARDRDVAGLVLGSGCDTLLSGIGPDHLFPVTTAHLADMLARGEFREMSSQLLDWTIRTRDSVWRTFPRHCLLPHVPPPLSTLLASRRGVVPEWMLRGFAKRLGVKDRVAAGEVAPTGDDGCYQALVAQRIQRVGDSAATWSRIRGIRMRHPFLHLPLVEFAARLPVALKTSFRASKPVLRGALKGVLPDAVLRRTGKATTEPRIVWALGRERGLIQALMKRSVLAEMGCLDPVKVMCAVDQAAQGRASHTSALYAVLAFETWFAVRSSRYPVNPASSPLKRRLEHAAAS